MGWKCETCDTFNDDAAVACFVCGAAKPAGKTVGVYSSGARVTRGAAAKSATGPTAKSAGKAAAKSASGPATKTTTGPKTITPEPPKKKGVLGRILDYFTEESGSGSAPAPSTAKPAAASVKPAAASARPAPGPAKKAVDPKYTPWPEHNIVFLREMLNAKGYVAAERAEMGGVKGYNLIRRDGTKQFMKIEILLLQKMIKRI